MTCRLENPSSEAAWRQHVKIQQPRQRQLFNQLTLRLKRILLRDNQQHPFSLTPALQYRLKKPVFTLTGSCSPDFDLAHRMSLPSVVSSACIITESGAFENGSGEFIPSLCPFGTALPLDSARNRKRSKAPPIFPFVIAASASAYRLRMQCAVTPIDNRRIRMYNIPDK